MSLRVQTFISKVGVETLHEMDSHINRWIADQQIRPTQITQNFGCEASFEGGKEVPVIVTSLWYEE